MTSSVAAAVMVVVEGCGDEYPHYLSMQTAPEVKNDTIMVSLQDLAGEMGWQTAVDAAASLVSVQGNGNMVWLQIGTQKAFVNETAVDMSAAPYSSGGIIMIPLKFMAESMGCHFESSKAWNNLDQVYVTPYNLMSDKELAQINEINFTKSIDSDGFLYYKLKNGGKTPGGISLNDSIWDVLQIYGVPRNPEPTLNYPGDWSGTLEYWGTFVPNSGMGTFYEFTFNRGLLVDLTVCC
jgi:Copper amine oxidase N-terminal domain.